MVRSTELAAAVAVCDESTGTIKPKRFGYFRLHAEGDGELFLSFAPADPGAVPIAARLNMEMTIREAIDILGSDAVKAAFWLFDGPP